MRRLPRRYDDQEFAILSACIKPWERWTVTERKAWTTPRHGFRQFASPNVTPIEHYQPMTARPPKIQSAV